MNDYEEVTPVGSSSQGTGLFSRIRNSYVTYKRWKFTRFHTNKLKVLRLEIIIKNDIGRILFDKYIKRHNNKTFPDIKRYWYAFLICRRIQEDKSLIKRPGIKHQLIELTRNFKWKQDVVRIIFEFEVTNNTRTLDRFLKSWEYAMLCGLELSIISFHFIRDLNNNNNRIKHILHEIYAEQSLLRNYNGRN